MLEKQPAYEERHPIVVNAVSGVPVACMVGRGAWVWQVREFITASSSLFLCRCVLWGSSHPCVGVVHASLGRERCQVPAQHGRLLKAPLQRRSAFPEGGFKFLYDPPESVPSAF